MKINRVWAMPNKWTFQIPPIADLLAKYVGDGKGWIDPFAGETSPAEFTNDLNPQSRAKTHLKAEEWLESLAGLSFKGLLFDPPYSLRQTSECYQSLGYSLSAKESNLFPAKEKRLAGRLIKFNGLSISFGWNSIGMGKTHGFEIIEILLVCHGRAHNDTIVTVERKIQSNLQVIL
jgi:hypothetical protein